MELRTAATVEAGVVWDETHDRAIFVEYQPGNGTRYPCMIVDLDLASRGLQLLGFGKSEPAGVFLFTWLGRPAGKAHVWRNEGFLHWTQLAEHLGCREPDARVLAELIAHYTNRTAEPAAATTIPPCAACGGTGRVRDPEASGVCPSCQGEGLRRAGA